MRILFTSHYALPHLGGIEFVIDALASRMVARGHEVTHIAATEGERQDASYRVIRVRASNFAERTLGLPYPIHHPLDLWRTVREQVSRADIVHAHGFLYQASALAMFFARRAGRPRLLTEHVGHVRYGSALTNAAESAAIATIGRATAGAAQAIIVLNDDVERQMRALVATQICQIPNGVDTEAFRPADADERQRLRQQLGWDERPRVVFVGRLVEKKGVHLAIEAARRSSGEFDLVLVGPGTIAGAPHVEHLGAVEPSRVAEIYRAADAFLLPSRGEGFPLSAQEALASGIPIILGANAAYEKILADAGDAARLVPLDAGTIVDAVREVLRDAPRRGEAAVAFARSHFDWSVTVDRHLDLYRELVARGGR